MKVLGLRVKRYAEWIRVLRSEGRRLGPLAIVISAWKAVSGGLTTREIWRMRMRDCPKCPVYDRSRHACRDNLGMGTGCGCWMPLKAMFRGPQCWAKRVNPAGDVGHRV